MTDIRLQTLEEKIADLLKTTDDLSDVVARQERAIAILTHRVQMLMEREGERESQGGGGIVLGDERPPHY
ncbi:SlyX family protein [Planktotalea sp.]|uniref:SlyX family protein n=1 Tax=Planktotalea sp. TaxID=2029877 RepID=UPI003F6ADAFE